MDKKKRQIFGNDVVHRIRSFVFGKRKGKNTNNNCVIPKNTAKQLRLTDNIQNIHQQWEKIEEKQQQEEQEQKENKKKKQKNKWTIPFSLFLKCVKRSLSTEENRRQLMWHSYIYFWDYLFGSCAAKARMAAEDEEQFYDFYDSDFDEEFF
ncbi:uncharacterized protein LOC134682069 [Mytilus trossulus]|uniref:uncharacterized protein LOC134682069 n=1 Tax=Mytilus trossulus TaxID=6551 RepID=UPI0030071EC6